ncbi:hypothetical protein ACE1AT_04670 [Pelatocladus sp. BLCC-F211]|uniref:hypothetical protein n=1 Tax=Pelatocladus sp. BLCC-F211 TaxID=3342752 RepID=UPI0035BA5AFA
MIINNAFILSLLFDQPEVANALSHTTPYIWVGKSKKAIVIKCQDYYIIQTLAAHASEVVAKLQKILSCEIYLQLPDSSIVKLGDYSGEPRMTTAVLEQSTNLSKPGSTDVINRASATKLYKLDALVKVTQKPAQEVKIMLARLGAAIYPREDGSELVAESHFDEIVLEWAKSIKGESAEIVSPKTTSAKPKKKAVRVLKSELTADDLAKVKSGKTAGSPNLTEAGVHQTLENFFNNKVKLEDMTIADAVSIFIEGTSEIGQAMRKKLIAAYRKFFPGANVTDIETKLVVSAKTYLETLTAAAQPIEEIESKIE